MSTGPLRSKPRPTRGGEDFARTHQPQGREPEKARFDTRNPSALAPAAEDEPDEEDENYLDADELTRRGNRVKRNAVNIDGFESDSSDDATDARAAEKSTKRRLDTKRKFEGSGRC